MPDANNVVLFSIDGMRPDALVAAETPHIDALIRRGAASLSARSVLPSVTLPCHTSLLRGVDVPRHGITSNTFAPLARPVPSLFDMAHAAGLRTGFFFNWGPLRDLCEPASLDVCYLWGNAYSADGDRRVAEAAARHISEEPFDFLFVYLGWTDECGHEHGWMSTPYLEAIAHADRCVGMVLDACAGTGRGTISLVVSDHGGHGRTHGTGAPEDMNVPWVLCGAGVREGVRLDAIPIHLYDAAPTLAALLGLKPAREWEGRIISEALEGGIE